MATLCIAEPRSTAVPPTIIEMFETTNRRPVRSNARAGTAASLRDWLGGQWGLIFAALSQRPAATATPPGPGRLGDGPASRQRGASRRLGP